MIRIHLPPTEAERLDALFRSTDNRKLRDRLQIVLLAHRGRARQDIAADLSVHRKTVTRWLNAYGADGLPLQPVYLVGFAVPEAGAGDVWVDNGTLYAAYHQGGLRIVDVTGEMAHDVYRQGRQAGWFMASETPGGVAMVLAARPYKGHIFAVDANSGLWVLSHLRAGRLTPK